MRALLIAFYFPPVGGGGVQRALKLCRYLPEFGVEVEVLAPDDAKWYARDEELVADIPPGTVVHRCRFLGPRAAFLGEAARGRSQLGRALVAARFAYARALVPDKALPWLLTAAPAAARIVRSRGIDVILSTSPPHSSHLVAAAAAAASGRPWVADFRDPWLVNPHRRTSGAVRLKHAVERPMARLVARRATRLTAVTPAIAAELAELEPAAAARTAVIANASDFADFAALAHVPNERFTITHTGAFFGRRSPRPFLQALARLLERRPDLRGRVLARFVGDLRGSDRDWARTLRIDDAWEETGFLPYRQAIAAQRAADALLLLIPDADGRGESVITGKVYEYLAARRPILAAVPPHGLAAALVRSTGAGVVVDGDDVEGLAGALEELADRHAAGELDDVDLPDWVERRESRRARAGELARLLQELR